MIYFTVLFVTDYLLVFPSLSWISLLPYLNWELSSTNINVYLKMILDFHISLKVLNFSFFLDFKLLPDVFKYNNLGCCNEYHKQQTFIFHSLKAGSPRSRGAHKMCAQVLVWALFQGCRLSPSRCGRDSSLAGVSSYKGPNPFKGLPSYWGNYPHLISFTFVLCLYFMDLFILSWIHSFYFANITLRRMAQCLTLEFVYSSLLNKILISLSNILNFLSWKSFCKIHLIKNIILKFYFFVVRIFAVRYTLLKFLSEYSINCRDL